MSAQNVNVARFARNVEWDFFCGFQTLWYRSKLIRLFQKKCHCIQKCIRFWDTYFWDIWDIFGIFQNTVLLSGRPNCMNIQTCKGSQGILMNIVQQIHQYIYTLTQNTYSPNGIFFPGIFYWNSTKCMGKILQNQNK